MSDADTNRQWLIRSHLAGQSDVETLASHEELETLLYYRSQLEAELDHVQQLLASLLAGSTRLEPVGSGR